MCWSRSKIAPELVIGFLPVDIVTRKAYCKLGLGTYRSYAQGVALHKRNKRQPF